MNKVILSEGKHDVYFLSEIHDRRNNDRNYTIYLTEEATDSQTKRLRQYLVDERYQYFYKSEEGDGNLIKKLRSHSLMFKECSIYILIDLDGDPISSFYSDINDKLYEDYGNKVQIQRNGQFSNQDMVILDNTLQIQSQKDRDIPIMAFYESLENVTGINYSEDRSGKIKKIKYYLDKHPQIEQDIADTVF